MLQAWEHLYPLDPALVEMVDAALVTTLTGDQIDALPVLEADRWPSELPRAAKRGTGSDRRLN